MKTLNTKLVLSALAIALLATPALAQSADRQPSQVAQSTEQYPNPVIRSGSASNQFEMTHGSYGSGE